MSLVTGFFPKTYMPLKPFSLQQILRPLWIGIAIPVFLLISILYGLFKPLPQGINYSSPWLCADEITFLSDLTYRKNGNLVLEQSIFKNVTELIENAEEFLLVDMFLFNNEYDRSNQYPAVAESLVHSLIKKKQDFPQLEIVVISDPINTFYGAYPSELFEDLKQAGIPVILTDLDQLRHSNFLYSGIYAPLFSHFGTKGKGWMSNPFSADSPKVTLRAFLKMLNFRANHRKIILSENKAIVSSANPHDASAFHSNIAFCVEGAIVNELLKAELRVLQLSGYKAPFKAETIEIPNAETEPTQTMVKLVTENQIQKEWLTLINAAESGDAVKIAMFYFSDRKMVHALKKADQRGVKISLLMDANKDAFGREKNGIPNRQVAAELVKGNNTNVRWYHTEGEQFHTKMLIVEDRKQNETLMVGGSANLTRRNTGNFNLEADLSIKAPSNDSLSTEVISFFDRIWNNVDGHFSNDFEQFEDNSVFKYLLYRFQEATGLCTF